MQENTIVVWNAFLARVRKNWCLLAWRGTLLEVHGSDAIFVSNKDESSSIVVITEPVWKRDPLMRNNRLVPTMVVETTKKFVDAEEDEQELEALPISNIRTRQKKIE